MTSGAQGVSVHVDPLRVFLLPQHPSFLSRLEVRREVCPRRLRLLSESGEGQRGGLGPKTSRPGWSRRRDLEQALRRRPGVGREDWVFRS